MSALTAERFDEFYRAVHGYAPFPWQSRVAARACDLNRNWPAGIALPTAAGKTACIDIAVFALACQAESGTKRTAPRRIFFVVDRRIVVDQASLHAKDLSKVLQDAESGILREVADALRTLAGDKRPLDVYTLRGGMYRDTAWARSPLQPTVIASTVDQVGSRLLFRGYGVSNSMRPVHAGLIGNDALILLDEAHCAKPFEQTVQYIEKYRQWGEDVTPSPFRFVSMTATPSGDGEVERDEADDRSHPVLGPRIAASKPATLAVAEKAKGKKWPGELRNKIVELAGQLMEHELAADQSGSCHAIRAVGVIVNRVAIAREVAAELRQAHSECDVILLTGRMRPIDRDAILKQLQPIFSGSNIELAKPTFVVATQCIEVGADLDFHALVTECASLDALRQRFGRLNRVAARPSAKGIVVVRGDQTEDTEDDPVYGKSLANTWKWLKSKSTSDSFDFGVSAVREATDGEDIELLNAPSPNAPVLFPAYLDCWVQTHPVPTPDPDPAVFLHGPQRDIPDVQVVFRADLGNDVTKWIKIVELCPPSSSEAVAVRLPFFRQWLQSLKSSDESGDVEGEAASEETAESERGRTILRWKGPEKSVLTSDPSDVRPGDTLIVGIDETDLQSLCDFLRDDDGNPHITDCGDEAYQRSRDKAILRLWPLELDADDEDFEPKLTAAIHAKSADGSPDWMVSAVADLSNPKRRRTAEHPLGGWVVTGKYRLHQFDPAFVEDDESSESPNGKPVKLEDHSRGVADYARRFATGCGLDADVYATVGLFHDIGKYDPRFQAMLKGRSPRTAGAELLAKSGSFGTGNPDVHRYPKGARHELLSAALLATHTDDDLLLHLIATHHGSARPFASCVEENNAAQSPFMAKLFDQSFSLDSAAQRSAEWNADLPERFWRIVRRFGWWGTAYREAVFRLSDHAQSRAEQEDQLQELPAVAIPPLPSISASAPTLHAIELRGFDGSNPLAFLAALGTLRTLNSLSERDDSPPWLAGNVKLSWGTLLRPSAAVIHVSGSVSENDLSLFLADRLEQDAAAHAMSAALELLAMESDEVPSRLKEIVTSSAMTMREPLDWITALIAELAPGATSQLQTVRRDYLPGNLASVMQRTRQHHLERSMNCIWDYRDALANQSLHWDPSEDRRHAYQWYAATSDPNRQKQGGMLGANRLAIEAWPFFQSWVQDEKMSTRGFTGIRIDNTSWTWPLWSTPLNVDAIASLLAAPSLQLRHIDVIGMAAISVFQTFRCRRILFQKTPNFTPAMAVS